jgi:DNA repair photolyase
MNAYRGCEFGCVYCDGMSEGYHVDDFLTHVRIKENAHEIVRQELEKDGFVCESSMETETLIPFLADEDAQKLKESHPIKYCIGVSGGVSDAYQQAEEEHRVTRKVLEVLLDFGMPVFVLTKSTLVLRDLDLLQRINEKAFATVAFTITLHDEDVKRVFEPKSPSTTERFDALKHIKEAGLNAGVMAMPLIPGIGDTVENMTALAKSTKDAGGDFIQWAGLTLKPGRQKDHFMSVLRQRFPDHYPKIQRIYQNDDKYGEPAYKILPCNVYKRGSKICTEIGIPDRMSRQTPPGGHVINTRIVEVLHDIAFYRRFREGDSWYRVRPLMEAAAKVMTQKQDLGDFRNPQEIQQILDVSSESATLIAEIVETGTSQSLESLMKA